MLWRKKPDRIADLLAEAAYLVGRPVETVTYPSGPYRTGYPAQFAVFTRTDDGHIRALAASQPSLQDAAEAAVRLLRRSRLVEGLPEQETVSGS